MAVKTGKANNLNLRSAQKNKNDEFYTQLVDIEKELQHYTDCFAGKTVYCNCDDPRYSNFFKYFQTNFNELGLKRLIASGYMEGSKGVYCEYTGGGVETRRLKGDGDFRSPECIEFLKGADIVITNPPFSLFRDFASQLVEYNKEFLIMANQNVILNKDLFPHIRDGRVWMGHNSAGEKWFQVPDEYWVKTESDLKIVNGAKYAKLRQVPWFTNLGGLRSKIDLALCEKYTPDKYPKYDNFNAINVNRTKDIPCDYMGVMGVPITFLHKHNPDQFEIIGLTISRDDSGLRTKKYEEKDLKKLNGCPVIKTGDKYKGLYARILIRRKNQ